MTLLAALPLALAVPMAPSGQRAASAIPDQPCVEECFRRVSANGGGFVTWDEVRPQREAEHRRMNRDRDGALSGDEFEDPALLIQAFDSIRVGQVSLAECPAKRGRASGSVHGRRCR